jgi:hypothetical protein
MSIIVACAKVDIGKTEQTATWFAGTASSSVARAATMGIGSMGTGVLPPALNSPITIAATMAPDTSASTLAISR